MHIVDRLFVGPQYATEVWISEQAAGALKKFTKRDRATAARMLRNVERWAESGFQNYEGDEGTPIRHEGHEVYRVAYRSSLFRLIGFYEKDNRAVFIIMDAFRKRGRKLSKPERERITEVASVRDKNEWRRRRRDEPNGA